MSLNGIYELWNESVREWARLNPETDKIETEEILEKAQPNMIICPTCKKQMQNIQSGVGIRYGIDANHVYYGDRYVCSSCKKEILWTISNPIHDNNYLPSDLYMDTTYGELFPGSRNLRQMEEDNDGPILQHTEPKREPTETI